jgi:hypothetical protein
LDRPRALSSITTSDGSFTNRIARLRTLPQHFIAAEKQCFHTVCLIYRIAGLRLCRRRHADPGHEWFLTGLGGPSSAALVPADLFSQAARGSPVHASSVPFVILAGMALGLFGLAWPCLHHLSSDHPERGEPLPNGGPELRCCPPLLANGTACSPTADPLA